MIVRTWSAFANNEKEPDYLKIVKSEIIPHLAQTPGYMGCHFLRQQQDSGWRYFVLTYWDSKASAYGLSDGDPHISFVPEKIQATLDQFDETVEYYEVAVEHGFGHRTLK
jgi:heme-degrading monooxygenase HmoA